MFTQLADHARKLNFVFAPASLQAEMNVTASFVVFRSFDEPAQFSGEVSEESLFDFIMSSSRPLVVEFSQDNMEYLFEDGRPVLFVMFNSSAETNEARDLINAHSRELSSKVVMTETDNSTELGGMVLEFFGLTEGFTGFCVVDLSN